MRKTVRCLTVVFILGVAIVGMVGCSQDKKAQTKSKKLPHVQAIAAESTRMVEFLEATGEVVAVNTVKIQSTVEGPISFCPWREGDHVEQAGQKIIEIDRPLYQQETLAAKAALALAQAKLDDLKAGARPEEIAQAKEAVRHFEDCTSFAKADLERIRSLVKSGSLPGETAEKARVDCVKCQTQLGAAKEQLAMLKAGPTKTEVAITQAAVNEAAAKLDLAQAKINECILSAPFAGIITSVMVRPGDLVIPRMPLLEMMDSSSLVVRFAVPETRIADINKNAKAVVRLDAYPGRTFNAIIERIYPELQHKTRTRLAEAKVLDPIDLLPGQFARISVIVKAIENAIVIPDKAVLSTSRGETVVYVVNNGKISKRKVKIGLEQEQNIQITHGVQSGEMVVTHGNEKLKDGAQVKIINTPPKPEEMKIQQIQFQGKFPIRNREYSKNEIRFNTLGELCQYFRDQIEQHPFARYIDTFDHYAHTTQLNDGIIADNILGAKNVIFCFGKKLTDPRVLSVRPRSIGICETKSQFVISFLETPNPTVTKTMEQWICDLERIQPDEDKQTSGGDVQ